VNEVQIVVVAAVAAAGPGNSFLNDDREGQDPAAGPEAVTG